MAGKYLPQIYFLLILSVIMGAGSSCNSRKQITFYLSNHSTFTPKDSIQVYVNGRILINQQFTYSNVRPDDEVFEFKLSDSLNILKIVELTHGLEKTDSIDINKDKYIFISFGESKRDLSPGDTIKRAIHLLKRKDYTKLY